MSWVSPPTMAWLLMVFSPRPCAAVRLSLQWLCFTLKMTARSPSPCPPALPFVLISSTMFPEPQSGADFSVLLLLICHLFSVPCAAMSFWILHPASSFKNKFFSVMSCKGISYFFLFLLFMCICNRICMLYICVLRMDYRYLCMHRKVRNCW